jgi:hypothetical protein
MLTRSWICLLSFSLPALCGNPHGPVTVLLEFDQPYSDVSVSEMEREAASVLKNTGLILDWEMEASLQPHPEFKALVVLKMKGSCEMAIAPELIDERGPLGMAYVTDGQVLSFGEIECDRIKQSVQRVLPPSTSARKERLYGRALGRVAAHEMVHMLRGSTRHSKSGINQASLTADELISNHIDLVDSIK